MPKIIGQNLAEHRAQVRAQLFDALADLLRQKGFDSITMAELAARANVGRTAVYNHFPDKESLLLAFITEQTKQYAAKIQEALTRVSDPIEKIRVYIRQQIRLNSSYQIAAAADLRHLVSSETAAELSAHALIVEDLLRSILREAMREGLIREQRAEPLIHLIHAALSVGIRAREPHEYAGSIIMTEEFILRGLGAEAVSTSREEYLELVEIVSQDLINQNVPGHNISLCPVAH